MGYTLGPVLGGILTTLGGYPLLFATLGLLAFAFLCWAALAVPALQPLPRARQTVLDLARGLSGGDFLRPTLALAATIAALSVGVGFLPVTGADRGLGALATGAVVSLLAAAATLALPWAGRLRDNGRISDRHGMTAGLLLTAAGFVLAVVLPGTAGLVLAAPVIGLGAGLVATIGFAHLAATPRSNASARPWEPPKWAANSATPEARCSSARSPPLPRSTPDCSASPHCSSSPAWPQPGNAPHRRAPDGSLECGTPDLSYTGGLCRRTGGPCRCLRTRSANCWPAATGSAISSGPAARARSAGPGTPCSTARSP